MDVRQSKYDKNVRGAMAEDIYVSSLRALVEPSQNGRVIAIDVDSGDYEIADTSLQASMALLARRSESQTHCRRIGPDPAVTHFYGFSVTKVAP